MWFTREHRVTFLIGAVFILFQLDGLGQFNRYYSHDRDSIVTSLFWHAVIVDNSEIVVLKEASEYHSSGQSQPYQFYLERFDFQGNRIEQFNINEQFGLDTSTFFWIPRSFVKDPVGGFRFYGEISKGPNHVILLSWFISSNFDSVRIDTLEDQMLGGNLLGMQLGKIKPDPLGGFFFHMDIPDTPETDNPGRNIILHLGENGDLDWYRTFQDRALHSETIMDITRSPITGDIYFCGNEAKTKGNCFSTPTNRDCENYAFVYRCDSLGQNCTRIYYAQDSVDAHQECNFIQVLSDGNIAVFHPIVDVEARVKLSSGTPRNIIMNEDGQIQKEIISTFPYSVLKFQAFFETELNRYQFISSTAWEIPGNQGPTGQIYNHTYEVGVYDNETYLGSQGIYIPEHISINSIYNLHSAQRLTDGRILVAGRMTHDSLNTTLPYMALSDTEGCFPEIPCVAVGVEDEELEIPNKQLTVYPNPAQNELNVILSGNSEVLLLDLNGRTIQSWQGQQGENLLELQGVSGGMYILKTATQTARVVVK